MSSHIRIKKICQHCEQSFIAKTTVTKFCSDDCAKRNYKKRLRDKKVTTAILISNEQQVRRYNNNSLKNVSSEIATLHREWLDIGDLSELLGLTERTLFRAIKAPDFPKLKIGRRLTLKEE
jgi:hypothetical protein